MTKILRNKDSLFHLRKGDRVEISGLPYVVERHVTGGMGCVYLLHQDAKNAPQRISALGLKLALKAIRPDMADPEGVTLFRRELAVWSAFRHPNIVWLLEILDGDDAGWVAAMDWCIGSLRDVQLSKGKLSLKESTDIIGDILDGLAYAYDQDKVLHLDLKPENILYHLDIGRLARKPKSAPESMTDFRFMISDWGIASIKQPALNAIVGLPPSSNAAQRTFNNMGTLLYMAPERFKEGFSSSIGSDVFALGMIYFELLIGCLPFSRDVHPVQALTSGKYIQHAISILSDSGVPKPISTLILRMIAYSPSNRASSHKELKKDIITAWRKSTGILSRLLK